VRKPLVAVCCVVPLVLGADPQPPPKDRVQQYLGLARATLARPITLAELEAAVLSRTGVRDVAALFEKALASALVLDGTVVTPELGGEATLDGGRLQFIEYPDPLQPLLRRMVEIKDDPKALLQLLSQSSRGQEVLRTTGGLHALLYQMATQSPPSDAQRRALDQVVLSAASIHFKTWTVDPELQREMIQKNDWRGRYVGFWHIHPPRQQAGAYAPGIEPSLEDMTNAIEKGQFVTIVFQPDGFDFYDLSPLAALGRPDLSKARLIRHRSEEWRQRLGAARRSSTSRSAAAG